MNDSNHTAPPSERAMRTARSGFAGLGRVLRAYSDWLAAITWGRFALLAILFLIAASFIAEMPFLQVEREQVERVKYEVQVDESGAMLIQPVGTKARKAMSMRDAEERTSVPRADKPKDDADVRISSQGIVIDAREGSRTKRITIDRNGVRVETPEGSSVVGADADGGVPAVPAVPGVPPVPPVKPALPALPALPAVPALPDAPIVAREDDTAKAAELIAARADQADRIEQSLDQVISELEDLASDRQTASRKGAFARSLQSFAMFFVIFSIILKVEAGRRQTVEVQAAEATELAEAEQLKRQLVEARMQAMQAQVEPHFLFNTLASIDHLIETDPPRASTMQKNLIQYLRAALPKMRESATTLGRETDLIRAYLEILKVRMDDRLATEFAVPDGLRSAAFPPMMLQSVIENAIKHGLEPKPEGGTVRVAAEIVDGHLRVSVADSGLGFDPDNNTATRGTGLGLSNIRERLALLYGNQGRLTVRPNAPVGTIVEIELPYEMPRA